MTYQGLSWALAQAWHLHAKPHHCQYPIYPDPRILDDHRHDDNSSDDLLDFLPIHHDHQSDMEEEDDKKKFERRSNDDFKLDTIQNQI
jgi:hypothetical protein